MKRQNKSKQPSSPVHAGGCTADELDAAWRAEGVPLLLTVHQAAAAVCSHYQTLWSSIQAGVLKAHKQGGRWRIMRRDLARWSLHNAHATLVGRHHKRVDQ